MTKRYVVAFSSPSAPPLGDLPPAGATTEEFDDFAPAREFAEDRKHEWTWVAIYDRTMKVGFTRIETYQGGRRFRS